MDPTAAAVLTVLGAVALWALWRWLPTAGAP